LSRKEFHDVVDFIEAKKKYYTAVDTRRAGIEEVSIHQACGRVLAKKITAKIDVPPFARSTRDGFAVVAADTFFADEENPREILFSGEKIAAGDMPEKEINGGICSEIATGAMVPRGANAVVMIEHAETDRNMVFVYRPATPGENIMHAGSDMMQGETLFHEGQVLSARETAVLAAQGFVGVPVCKKPVIGIISTGNEILEPGEALSRGKIYDINSRIISDFCKENAAEPKFFGIVKDEFGKIKEKLLEALVCDMIIISGGTSAGTGDICYRVLEELGRIIVHGVAIKPGKPIVLGVAMEKPLIILPGFPTSAAVTFDLFVRPLIRMKAGLPPETEYKKIHSTVATRINSDKGKHELVLVNLVKNEAADICSAYPITKSSGSITTFSFADGFLEIPANTETVPKNSQVVVNLFSEGIRIADINFIGSHCVMLEPAVNMLRRTGFTTKIMHVGSTLGLEACRREEADITGTHLLDEKTEEYNIPFLLKDEKLVLFRGYIREQGIVYRKNTKIDKTDLEGFVHSKNLRFINRNKGSGTRILFDILLEQIAREKDWPIEDLKINIAGYDIEANTHTAVSAAVALGKADWGIAIKTAANNYGLAFIPLRDEHYDFCIPKIKLGKPSVKKFLEILKSNAFREELLESDGIKVPENIGKQIWPK
jgi:molybdenum cofactor synthesis domain-containing protein